MRIVTATLLFFSIMLITFSKSIIALQYEINKKFIASTLCENRNKPMSHCNGACHLKKTMNNDEQKENAPGSSAKGALEIELFAISTNEMLFNANITTIPRGIYTIAAFIEPCFSVFHPPTFA